MAIHANSTAAPGRRSFLRGAAASALAAAIPAAADAGPRPDAGLTALFHEWKTLADRYDAASAERDRVEDGLVFPEVPETLFERPEDRGFTGIGLFANRRHDGRRWYSGDAIKELRHHEFVSHWDGNDEASMVPVIDTRKSARRDEIVAAWDQWCAEMKAVEEASGYRAASLLCSELSADNSRLRAAIIAMQAETMEGLQLKAQVVAWSACTTMDGWIEELNANGTYTADVVAASVCRDLLAIMQKSGPA